MTNDELLRVAHKHVNEEHVSLTKLYVFCEKVHDVQGKTSVLTAFHRATFVTRENGRTYGPSLNIIEAIYEGTMDGDLLRKFCVDYFAVTVSATWFATRKAEHFHLQFVFDVMTEMVSARAAPTDSTKIKTANEYCKMLVEAGTEPCEASIAS